MELTPENVLAVMEKHFTSVSMEDFATNVAAASGNRESGTERDLPEKLGPPGRRAGTKVTK